MQREKSKNSQKDLYIMSKNMKIAHFQMWLNEGVVFFPYLFLLHSILLIQLANTLYYTTKTAVAYREISKGYVLVNQTCSIMFIIVFFNNWLMPALTFGLYLELLIAVF